MMSKVYISKEVKFCAAHRLHNPSLTDEENKVLYGKCNSLNGHGHNYVLEVTFSGKIDPKTGMVINFYDIDALLEKHIIKKFDHKHLDKDIPEFSNLVSTSENLVVVCWDLLKNSNFPVKLHKLSLKELDDCIVDYYGE
jgi:6-pyruvoyltetrahydropterin/6-carboxytetrahydropterin synthase